MKFIETYWDDKSLGMRTYEIICEEKDKAELISKSIKETIDRGNNYIVVKVPILRYDINSILSAIGFIFVETQLTLHICANKFYSYTINQEKGYDISIREEIKTMDQLENIISLIGNNMFVTDRISLHNKFGNEYASIRYKNWIRSNFNKENIIIFQSYLKDKIAGFGMHKIESKKVYGLLGGVFEPYQSSGLFASGLYSELKDYFSSGYNEFIVSISSNNISVMKLYMHLGFNVSEIKYVFHNFIEEDK